MHKEYLRSKIGWVHQKPFLFSTNIQDNIAYVKPDSPNDKVMEVAQDAEINSFIAKLSDGYKTLVGEKGVNLSGGQKQRIALARTLLGNPDILVLDDATSAVDTETEYNIQQALRKHTNEKTCLIIAHRLTSIQYADTIMVMEEGAIKEKGSHEELLAQDGFYKKVYDIQVSIEESIEKDIKHD